jgi:uncharacterized protein (TIGR00106 family)
MNMLVEFSIVPLGAGSSVSDRVARVLDIVDKSGIPYRITPMGTVVEGEWEEAMGLIKKCRDELIAGEARLLITIRIDDKKGISGMLENKIASVEKRLQRPLQK